MSLIKNISLWLLKNKPAAKSQKNFVNWKDISSILVLANEDQLRDLEGFIGKAEKDSKSVLIAFTSKAKPGNIPSPSFKHLVISKKELTVFGMPQHNMISQLNAYKADVLINLGERDHTSLLALSKLTQASCKIARFEDPLFDMSISRETLIDTKEFLEQVYTYLNMIKND